MTSPTLANATRAKRRAGFTLIELLVVIAIIAILAAILFPVFAQARNKARATVCLSNQKQISMGFQMYAQDYDETMPYARSYCSGTPANDFTQLLSGYIQNAYGANAQKQAALWSCPNDSTVRNDYSGSNTPNSYAAVYYWDLEGDRAAAWTWEQDCPGGKYFPGRSLSEFKAPASTLVLAEKHAEQNVIGVNKSYVLRPNGNLGQNCAADDDWGNCTYPSYSQNGAGKSGIIKPRHNDGWNYMFADGHVKWSRPEATIGTGTLLDPRGFWTLKDND